MKWLPNAIVSSQGCATGFYPIAFDKRLNWIGIEVVPDVAVFRIPCQHGFEAQPFLPVLSLWWQLFYQHIADCILFVIEVVFECKIFKVRNNLFFFLRRTGILRMASKYFHNKVGCKEVSWLIFSFSWRTKILNSFLIYVKLISC